MPHQASMVELVIGSERWPARLEIENAPRSSARLQALLPYRGDLVHARWSGEACWAPLALVWPAGEILEAEFETSEPAPGEILLFAGPQSEPELFIPYGANRFACRAGRVAGNRVLRILDRLDALEEVGRQVLWNGVQPIEISAPDRGIPHANGSDRMRGEQS